MSNEVTNTIKENLKAIFPDEITANKIIDLATAKRPPGHSRKSATPYYKEYYARWLQPSIDKMIETRESIYFPYKAFCGEREEIMSKTTLYARVNQSTRYLIDCLDPDNKYKAWRAIVNITRDKKRGGVVIEFIPEFRNYEDENGERKKFPEPQMILSKDSDAPMWRRRLDEWLESTTTTPFLKEKLCLTEQEVYDLKMELNSLGGIKASVSQFKVAVIRMNI